ncbi:FAD dependent oxidoreductase [Myxozyma melibiosi]|uniref:FAD dependent oxidoreductase n=1 Tax=Myxozyma melibiosi TaxID=54550 RepID=A0ABR1F0B6_9ASCO
MRSVSSSGIHPSASRPSPWLDPPPAMLANMRTTPSLPETADLVIVGAGFSGVSVAYHALKAYPGMRIVLLEAGDVCNGATGRNGGHLRPDYYTYTTDVLSKFGPEEAVRHNKFERRNFEALMELIEQDGVECETDKDGEAWQVFLSPVEFRQALNNLAVMRDLGGDVHDVRVYMREEARRITGIQGCFGAIASPATPISPTKLVSHLVERSLANGLNLQTNVRATKISRNVLTGSSSGSESAYGIHADSDSDGFEEIDGSTLRIAPKRSSFLYKVQTTRGAILANKVVHATNAYLDSLLSISSDIISTTKSSSTNVLVTPTRGHVIEIEPLGEGRKSLSLDPNHKITNMSFNYGGEYLVQRPNGNFVLGGGRRYGRGQGYEELSSTAASSAEEEIDAAVDLHLRAFFTQTLCFDNARFLKPTLSPIQTAETNATYSETFRVVNQWTGIMGFSTDSFPIVGKVPSFVEQSQEYCIAGFTGHGMPRIFLAAKQLVRQILAEDPDFQFDLEYSQSTDHGGGGVTESFMQREAWDGCEEMPECFGITEERLSEIITALRQF